MSLLALSERCFVFQVRNIIEDPPCSCPAKFPVEKHPKGRYRVGEKVLYVRVCQHPFLHPNCQG